MSQGFKPQQAQKRSHLWLFWKAKQSPCAMRKRLSRAVGEVESVVDADGVAMGRGDGVGGQALRAMGFTGRGCATAAQASQLCFLIGARKALGPASREPVLGVDASGTLGLGVHRTLARAIASDVIQAGGGFSIAFGAACAWYIAARG